MANRRPVEVIEVLSCDIGRRPKAAPGLYELASRILSVEQTGETLTVEFAREAAEDVRAFVAAERQCCAHIAWDLDDSENLRLTVRGTPTEVEALARLLNERA